MPNGLKLFCNDCISQEEMAEHTTNGQQDASKEIQ